MSRRCHHGSPRHARGGHVRRRPIAPDTERRPTATTDPETPSRTPPESPRTPPLPDVPAAEFAAEIPTGDGRASNEAPSEARTQVADRGRHPDQHPADTRRSDARASDTPASDARASDARTPPVPIDHAATAPQLRRFIKSRAYVPMHELRRRFGINGGEDDVTAVDLHDHRVFVGLPDREGQLLGELLRGGDIGYELSLDPISPIVVGVYPMRPVSRS